MVQNLYRNNARFFSVFFTLYLAYDSSFSSRLNAHTFKQMGHGEEGGESLKMSTSIRDNTNLLDLLTTNQLIIDSMAKRGFWPCACRETTNWANTTFDENNTSYFYTNMTRVIAALQDINEALCHRRRRNDRSKPSFQIVSSLINE